MNSRHAIRERPHVCTTLSVASDVKEEEVGWGGKLCAAVIRTAVC